MRKVRTLSPEKGGRLPALALTAYAGDDDRTAAMRAGYQAFVAKPVSAAQLVVKVAQVAGRQPRAASSASDDAAGRRRRRADDHPRG